MLTRMALGIALGVLLLGAVARAEPAPAETRLAPQSPALAPGGQSCDCCSCGKRHPILEWLTYRPYRGGCYGRQCACCRPPLYTFFLDYCQAGGGTAYPLRLPPTCGNDYSNRGCGCR